MKQASPAAISEIAELRRLVGLLRMRRDFAPATQAPARRPSDRSKPLAVGFAAVTAVQVPHSAPSMHSEMEKNG